MAAKGYCPAYLEIEGTNLNSISWIINCTNNEKNELLNTIKVIKSLQTTEINQVLLPNQNNKKAFSPLYDRYAPLIYGVILRQVQNDQLASEILKSTFINVIAECKKFDCMKQSFFLWLLLLTRKTASVDYKVDLDLNLLSYRQVNRN